MVLSPFRRNQAQKTFSLTLIIVSLLVVMVSLPFSLSFGGFVIGTTILGVILFLIGLIYFIDSVA